MISIQYNNGRVLQGVALAFGDRRVRVAVKGCDDAVEFRLVHEVWVSEDCEVVRLDFAERSAPAETETGDPFENLFPVERRPEPLRRVM